MKNILSVLPPRLGGLDMMLPIYQEMKLHSDVFIEVIFLNKEVMSQIKKDNYLNYQLLNTVDRITVIELKIGFKSIAAIFKTIKGIFGLLFLTLRIILYKKNPILLHAANLNSRFIQLLNWLTKRKNGLTIGHFKLMGGGKLLDEKEGGRLLPVSSNTSDSSKFSAKNNIVNELYGDYFAIFNKDNVESWDIESKKRCIEIGYTRVYKSWIDKLKNDSIHHRNNSTWFPDFKGKSPFSLIYLPSTLKNVFDEDELENWLMEVIPILSQQLPDNPIILKPHPLQKMNHLRRVLSKMNNINCLVSFVHPGLLAAQAQVVISHHSTTIIDAMALNVPVIHHQFYTDHWLKRHPLGSSLLGYGQIKTYDDDSLRQALKDIESIQSPYISLIKNIKHSDNIQNLFDKMKLSDKTKSVNTKEILSND